MTATTNPDSAPAGRSDELHELAVQLYELIGSGHDALAYNVDARGAALTAIGVDGKRRPVQAAGREGADPPAWQRARELRDGVEVDRRFNPWVLGRHLRGRYSVAPAAGGWVQWVALDIDAHPVPGSPEHVARRLAKERADRVLAGVWRALGGSAERHPLVLRSPGGGYHVWLPLTRGPTSTNPEHTWPAAVARAWVERHLLAAGLELAPGVLEVFPSGRCLRAPCGLGMQVLQATRPDDPDALGLVPWPGTMTSAERVDWRGERGSLSAPVRRVVPMVRTFVAQWQAQRRTLADWLGRPEASWDPTWGFLGWRDEGPEGQVGPGGEISSAEKNSAPAAAAGSIPSQELVDVPGRLQGRSSGGRQGRQSGGRRSGQEGGSSSASSTSDEILIPPSAQDIDRPPDLAGDSGVRGRAFREKVQVLLTRGVKEPGTRHDAVLTLAFYWAATCGLGEVGALARLDAWCKAHPHAGSRLSDRPRLFRDTCVREAAHYIAHHAPRWRFIGKGDGGGLATLTPADQAVVAAADARVQGEVSAILAWLAGRADGEGRIGEPVQIATGLLARLCGDRRVDEGGQRRRTTTLAIAELERLGVLTLAREYRVGYRGRAWCCWYRFGSGELPRAVEISSAAWSAIAPAPEGSERAEVPLVAEADGELAVQEDSASVAPVVAEADGELAVQEDSASVAPAAEAAPVSVRVLGGDDHALPLRIDHQVRGLSEGLRQGSQHAHRKDDRADRGRVPAETRARFHRRPPGGGRVATRAGVRAEGPGRPRGGARTARTCPPAHGTHLRHPGTLVIGCHRRGAWPSSAARPRERPATRDRVADPRIPHLPEPAGRQPPKDARARTAVAREGSMTTCVRSPGWAYPHPIGRPTDSIDYRQL
jgi:hypothetical protein